MRQCQGTSYRDAGTSDRYAYRMFGFSVTITAVALTILLAAIGLAYLLFGWLRKRSWRVMLRGVGFISIPLGLLAMGLMHKIIDGINAIVNWANTTFMNAWIMTGLIVAGLGLAAYLVGSFVPAVSGDEAAARRKAINERRLAALRASAGAPATTPTAAPKPPQPTVTEAPSSTPALAAPTHAEPAAPAPATADMSAEDKEVDEILRRHGIN